MTLSTTLTRSQKPLYNLGQGARIDWSNRMSAGLVLAVPFVDYPVKTPWELTRGSPATATASPTWGQGPLGSYMTFNGSSQNVNYLHFAALNLGNGPFTFAIGFKRSRTSVGTYEHVCLKSGTGAYAFTFPTSSNALTVEAQNVGSIMASTNTITDTTTFHHGVWTRSSGGTTNKLYVDGVDRSGTVTSRTLSDTTTALVCGGDTTATGTWGGSLIYVYLWNRALGGAEVLSMYREPWQVLLPVLPARRWLAAAGIVNPLTLMATQTQAGTLQKQVNLPRLAAQAQAGTRQSQVNLLPKVGTQAQTPTRRSNVQLLPKLATQAQTATSPKTVQPVAKTATQAQVATAAEQLVKLLTFLATQPQAATVQKLAQKVLSATQAQTGAVAKVVAKTLLAAQPGASTLIRTVAKPLSAVQAQAASLQNQVNKLLLATQAQVATESGIRPFTGTALTLLATQAQVASVTKQIGKALTATLGGQVGPTCRDIILVGNRLAKRITNFVYTRL